MTPSDPSDPPGRTTFPTDLPAGEPHEGSSERSSVPEAPVVDAAVDEARPVGTRRSKVRRSTKTSSTRPPAEGGESRLPAAETLPAVKAQPLPPEDGPRSAEPPAVHPRYAVRLDEDKIDPDVQKVVRRLVRHGYEAYLVGGCVRDLLLGGKPKDFDVATSARPEQVRDLFRNSRVIGRRFRLVHVLFGGGKVIEVATFRRNPHEESEEDAADPRPHDSTHLLIRSDNVFGEAHEDATRRDFTINALFYDLEASQILDWTGGLADVERRVVNTIGEPTVRFREDPVRILRALKFAGRLDLGIAPQVYDAIVACRSALELAARPRISEEILRLMRGGQARRTIFLAWETGVLDVLLPELAALLYDSFGSEGSPGDRVFRLLEYADNRIAEERPLDDAVLWTLLLLEPLKEAMDGARDRGAASAELLEPIIERLAVPRRFADAMRRIVAVLPRLVSGKVGRFARTELFELALDVAEADLYARGASTDIVASMRNLTDPAARPGPGPRHRGPARALAPAGRPRPTPRH
ncbi:MAG: polynucleotide adenylyltransferase PcnB [Myxococcales bacterium]|nr:polynucleotide adenylyltransferase PcnB [Myxococcales bacterium]